jgi:hypothetical protein
VNQHVLHILVVSVGVIKFTFQDPILILCTNNRDELYKECVAALHGGLLLRGKDFKNIKGGFCKC